MIRAGQRFAEETPTYWRKGTVFVVRCTAEGDSGRDIGFDVERETYEVWDRERFLRHFVRVTRGWQPTQFPEAMASLFE